MMTAIKTTSNIVTGFATAVFRNPPEAYYRNYCHAVKLGVREF